MAYPRAARWRTVPWWRAAPRASPPLGLRGVEPSQTACLSRGGQRRRRAGADERPARPGGGRSRRTPQEGSRAVVGQLCGTRTAVSRCRRAPLRSPATRCSAASARNSAGGRGLHRATASPDLFIPGHRVNPDPRSVWVGSHDRSNGVTAHRSSNAGSDRHAAVAVRLLADSPDRAILPGGDAPGTSEAYNFRDPAASSPTWVPLG